MRPRRKSTKSRVAAPPVTVTVDSIGARGDGVAQGPSGPLFIPGTAPGDTVVAAPGEKRGDGWAAKMLDLITPGPDRVDPVCQHAATCGGCSLQHLDLSAIARIKRGHLVEALSRRGISEDLVAQTREVPPGTRRRLRLTIVRPGGRAMIGFNVRGTSRLIDIQECPVARPEIVALLPALRDLATSMNSLGKGGDIQVTLSDTGFDLMFIPARPSDPDLAERQRLVSFAEKHDIARIAWESDGFAEPVAARRPARLVIAGVPVDLPIGAFLQPSREGRQSWSIWCAPDCRQTLKSLPTCMQDAAVCPCRWPWVGQMSSPLRGNQPPSTPCDGRQRACVSRRNVGIWRNIP